MSQPLRVRVVVAAASKPLSLLVTRIPESDDEAPEVPTYVLLAPGEVLGALDGSYVSMAGPDPEEPPKILGAE